MSTIIAMTDKTVRSTRRDPGAAMLLTFTSTVNTVAGTSLRWKKIVARRRTKLVVGRRLAVVWTQLSNQPSETGRRRPLGKILCITTVFIATVAGTIGTAAAGGAAHDPTPPDLLQAKLFQAGADLIFTVRSRTPLHLGRFDRLPPSPRPGSRYLCLALSVSGSRGERRLCLGGTPSPRHRIGLELINAAGKTTAKETLAAHVKSPNSHKLVLALAPEKAGLKPQRYRWRVLENRRGCQSCGQSLPAADSRAFRLRPVRAVGCTGGDAELVSNGPRDHNLVALTFDDGPSSYTEGFLSVLREKHARGTFFEIGQEVPGRAQVMQQILSEGNEIGNHTTHHGFFPGYADLAETNALIRAATHFEPCLFRPPGGAVNSSVVTAAGEAGLKTIVWDVDPADWTNPGSGAVYSRIVDAAQPGSIILMHDGGGDRSGTLAALPAIIDTLRSRGYRFATVSELLGNRLIYRPYG
jgi:peptidoglycan/xylan/chitin deacetylase (PgdA/CDA1 family)